MWTLLMFDQLCQMLAHHWWALEQQQVKFQNSENHVYLESNTYMHRFCPIKFSVESWAYYAIEKINITHTCQYCWPLCRQDTSQRCCTQCHTVSSTWYWYWKSNWNCMEYHWREWSNLDRGNIHSYISFLVFGQCFSISGVSPEVAYSRSLVACVISRSWTRGRVLVCGGASFLSLSISVRGVCWEGLF